MRDTFPGASGFQLLDPLTGGPSHEPVVVGHLRIRCLNVRPLQGISLSRGDHHMGKCLFSSVEGMDVPSGLSQDC